MARSKIIPWPDSRSVGFMWIWLIAQSISMGCHLAGQRLHLARHPNEVVYVSVTLRMVDLALALIAWTLAALALFAISGFFGEKWRRALMMMNGLGFLLLGIGYYYIMSFALWRYHALSDLGMGLASLGFLILLTNFALLGLTASLGVGRALLLTPSLVRSWSLHPALRRRGYDWITREQCADLWALCGERAFSLPPWSDVGVLPEVSQGELAGIAEVAKSLKGKLR